MQELEQDQIEHVAGARRIKCPPIMTTLALGEEGGPITTLAVGEEGPVMTTMIVGEEDGGPVGTPVTAASALGSF